MSDAATTLFGLSFDDLREDVYFRDDFIALHNRPYATARLEAEGFLHGAGVRPIPGLTQEDLWTPHGYGGPLARDGAALRAGLGAWREQQAAAGRVAEFIRFHPCLDPAPFREAFDMLALNRATVMVDVAIDRERRRENYSQSTRRFLRRAEEMLTVRMLASSEWLVFKTLHDAMLDRHAADNRYRLTDEYVRDLMAQPWCTAWVAEANGRPAAASCFLFTSSPVAHYHLGGAGEAGLRTNAQFLLFETAFDHAARQGCRLMHLGGGRNTDPNDSLYQFKQRFSSITAHFMIGGLVFDRAAYESLGGARGGAFLGYREAAS